VCRLPKRVAHNPFANLRDVLRKCQLKNTATTRVPCQLQTHGDWLERSRGNPAHSSVTGVSARQRRLRTFLPSPVYGRFDLIRTFGSAFEIETPTPPGASRMRQLRRDMPRRLAQSWRVGKFDDDGGLGQPPTANSSFSRITLSGSSRGNSGSRSGVIAWRNSLISVRQSSSVRSSGHSAASGSQHVTGGLFRGDFHIGDHDAI